MKFGIIGFGKIARKFVKSMSFFRPAQPQNGCAGRFFYVYCIQRDMYFTRTNRNRMERERKAIWH